MNTDPLTDELGNYENQWVAILESERKIVGSGDTAVEAKQEAKTRGYSEIALFKVPAAGKMLGRYSTNCVRLLRILILGSCVGDYDRRLRL